MKGPMCLAGLVMAALVIVGCEQFNKAVKDVQNVQTGDTANRGVKAANKNVVDARKAADGDGADTSSGTGTGTGTGTTTLSGSDKEEADKMLDDMRRAPKPRSRPAMPTTNLDGVKKFVVQIKAYRDAYKSIEARWLALLQRTPNWNSIDPARRNSRYRDIGPKAAKRREQGERNVLGMAASWDKRVERQIQWLDERKHLPPAWDPAKKHQSVIVAEGVIMLARSCEAPADVMNKYTARLERAKKAVARVNTLKKGAAPKPQPKPKVAAGDEKLRVAVLRDSWKIHLYNTVGDGRKEVVKSSKVQDVALSADGRYVVMMRDSWKVVTYDTTNGQKVGEFKGNKFQGISCNADASKILVLGDGWLAKLYTRTGKQLVKIKVTDAQAVALSGDGKRIIVMRDAWKVKSYDAATGKMVSEFKGNKVSRIATNHDGSKIAIISDNWRIQTWTPTGKKLGSFKVNKPWDLAMTPDGKRIVVISDAWRVQTWDVETGKMVSVFKVNKAQRVAVSGR